MAMAVSSFIFICMTVCLDMFVAMHCICMWGWSIKSF